MKDQDLISDIRGRFDDLAGVLRLTEEHLAPRIGDAAELILAAYRQGGAVFAFGNGGSAADAQHLVGELVGRFLRERPGFRAQALGTDTAVLTSVANDYGFDHIFARELLANARAGDVAIAITTSGNSPNVVQALKAGREMGLKTIALTGAGGGLCGPLADVLLDVPCSGPTPRIQEAHGVVYHILCEIVERELVAAE